MKLLSLLLVLPLVLGLHGDLLAGQAPVDVSGIWAGRTSSKLALRGFFTDRDPTGGVAMALDQYGEWVALDAEGIEYGGTYRKDGKKVLMSLGTLGEQGIKILIGSWILDMAADDGILVEDLDISLASVKIVGKPVSTKRGRSLKLNLRVKFSASAYVDGRLRSANGVLTVKSKLEFIQPL